MEIKTYYDAFIVDEELYVINPKDGMIQCITKPRTAEELLEVGDVVDEHREKRDIYLMDTIKAVEAIWIKDDLLPEKEIRSKAKKAWEVLRDLKRAMYYGRG